MVKLVTEVSSGSVAVSVGTVTCAVPAGFSCDADATLFAVGVRSTPKFALATDEVTTATARLPLTVPSLPAPVPMFSPVLTHPDGRDAAGAAAPTVPCVVLSTTV